MKRILILLLSALFVFFSAEYGSTQNKSLPRASIKTYKDIPGVTKEEISAIEALKADRANFSYGVLFATEFFILPDGSLAGFTPKLCTLLSELFGIPFVPEMYEWDELMEQLNAQAIDFTGELTPTEERKQKYSMSPPIA